MARNYEFESSDRLWSAYRRALGPTIQKALDDPDIIEVWRNPDGKLWVDHLTEGRKDTGETMPDYDALAVVQLVAESVHNTTVGWNDPKLAAEMPVTGERFQATLPPLVEGIAFNIRKKILLVLTLQDYVDRGIMTRKQADYLIDAVRQRKNIMVAGGTGAGKTTLANALMALGDFTKHRILQIEDRRELQCDAADIVRILTSDGSPEVTAQQVVVLALRMRPDRIVMGEVREGAPALALAKASNTGHPGCISTIHCNDAEEAYDRMAEVISEVSVTVPHRLIRRTLEVVVHIQRIAGEGFKVTEIRVPTGYNKATEEFETEVVAA